MTVHSLNVSDVTSNWANPTRPKFPSENILWAAVIKIHGSVFSYCCYVTMHPNFMALNSHRYAHGSCGSGISKDAVEMACLWSMKTGTSARKTWGLGMTQWLGSGILQSPIHSQAWPLMPPVRWDWCRGCQQTIYMCPLQVAVQPSSSYHGHCLPVQSTCLFVTSLGSCVGSLLFILLVTIVIKVFPGSRKEDMDPPLWRRVKEFTDIFYNINKICLTLLIILGFCHSCWHVAGPWLILFVWML